MMKLSMEEIELRLRENEDDLIMWREYLYYYKRHDLTQEKYIPYLMSKGWLCLRGANSWEISNVLDLDILRGVVDNYVSTLTIHSTLESTVGIEDFVAPKLSRLHINKVSDFELTKLAPRLYIYLSKVRFTNDIDFRVLTRLHLHDADLGAVVNLDEAINLMHLSLVGDSKLSVKLNSFRNLKSVAIDNLSRLELWGNSDTVESILSEKIYIPHAISDIRQLVEKGWYPNLLFPIQGKKKQRTPH